jgi:hypothetical protein
MGCDFGGLPAGLQCGYAADVDARVSGHFLIRLLGSYRDGFGLRDAQAGLLLGDLEGEVLVKADALRQRQTADVGQMDAGLYKVARQLVGGLTGRRLQLSEFLVEDFSQASAQRDFPGPVGLVNGLRSVGHRI